ncbi:DUF3422 domain-containing protein [Neptuniibacter sp.]|uniref:DUF3422 domain-containing protein n=1 Tax=Neptuniibacter sp. TaxID=1962643 RepID=UPI002616449A|nr:DUF3422 domain-containing protein [Neptuniibacter sp.]MCP4596856.1 DUF3422 domain-containing protein [Neptuniibacter sp.]
MQNHALRTLISQEVHARPFQRLYPDLGLIHIAATCTAEEQIELEQILSGILVDNEIPLPEQLTSFFYSSNDDMALRYEPHNEFYTLTLYQFGTMSVEKLQPLWKQLPGSLLSGVEILFGTEEQGEPDLKQYFGTRQVSGSMVMGKAARLWTDFYPSGEDGFVRMRVQNCSLKSFQAGRLLQRLCEIETYRHTALLALPVAQQAMPQVTEMDQQLAAVTHRIANSNDAPELLQELMELAARVEELSAETANRFSATEAYFAVLDRRIEELREDRIEGLQTVEQFVERRLDPARKTCLSANERIERLSRRITRTSELLRSQVELSIEEQNQLLLEGLNDRSRRQLRLQAKLESFTIIVVTYYAFDLLERSIRNTVQVDALQDQILMWISMSVPLIAGALWWYVRRLLKHYGEE